MYGAILGDMIGAPYEFDRSPKTKEFPLFGRGTEYTDDSVMSIAVAEALIDAADKTDDELKAALVYSMQKWGRRYPDAGYGVSFSGWLRAKKPEPYGSYGNGSAMRVSAAGWLYASLEETRHKARLTAETTHNHPEGIKGAEATASAIFLARTGASKEEIREYIASEFDYDLSRTCDEIRPDYHHVESCQKTVPEAITAFLEGTSFEDVIRTAVSLGGDCDTLTCIAGSIAEAFYGVPKEMAAECRKRLPKDMLAVLDRFMGKRSSAKLDFNSSLIDETFLKRAADICRQNQTGPNTIKLLKSLLDSRIWIPCNAVMSAADYAALENTVKAAEKSGGPDSLRGRYFENRDSIRMVPDILQKGEDYYFPVFTSEEEMGEYGEHFSKLGKHFIEAVNLAKNNEKKLRGIVVNAFSEPFIVPSELFDLILNMPGFKNKEEK